MKYLLNYLLSGILALLCACEGGGRIQAGGAPVSGPVPINDTPSFASVRDTVIHYRPATFTLQSYSRIPGEIDGCSGLFASDTAALRQKSYVFATDLQTLAFIYVDGELIPLHRTWDKLAEDAIIEAYEGEGFRVELNLRRTEVLGDELWRYEGEMLIRRGDEERKIPVTGEVGC